MWLERVKEGLIDGLPDMYLNTQEAESLLYLIYSLYLAYVFIQSSPSP